MSISPFSAIVSRSKWRDIILYYEILNSTINLEIKKTKWLVENFNFFQNKPFKTFSFLKRVKLLNFNEIISLFQNEEIFFKILKKHFRGYCYGIGKTFVDEICQKPYLHLHQIDLSKEKIAWYTALDIIRNHFETINDELSLTVIYKHNVNPTHSQFIDKPSLSHIDRIFKRENSYIILLRSWTLNLKIAHTFTLYISRNHNIYELFDSNPYLGFFSYPCEECLREAFKKLLKIVYPKLLCQAEWEVSFFDI